MDNFLKGFSLQECLLIYWFTEGAHTTKPFQRTILDATKTRVHIMLKTRHRHPTWHHRRFSLIQN